MKTPSKINLPEELGESELCLPVRLFGYRDSETGRVTVTNIFPTNPEWKSWNVSEISPGLIPADELRKLEELMEERK